MLAPLLGSIALVLSLLGGCSREEASTPGSARAPSEHLVAAIQVEPASTITRHERPGSLRFRRLVRLFSQEEGRVTQFDLFEGDRVAADALLVVLDDDLLLAELDRARATRAQAELDVQRLSDLVARRAASDAELSQARTALAVAEADVRLLETRLAFTRISAPFAGVVTERLVEPGDFVGKNTHLLTIADPDSLVAEVFVSEFILPGVRRADPAQVRIDALGTATFPAQVLRIHPQLEATSRQGLIELALEEAPPGAAAGQFVRVTLETAAVERLMIPFRALRRDRDGELVWVIEESGAVARRSVRSGLQMDDRIEILDGLTAGERIVTRGFLGLSEGKTVRVVPE
ncbi:efflux RND transporter periplasmic adaptor subunit [Thiocapsa imhoffii]|uniref:efflux RND transporter periplasmic adaptor subunit n=1 Tax=Thiocapsa imhoffii TaxID=382777 RepID=UPI001A910CF8|nr:efflux RND transporter periplasmic adaptor subunit [Thiocapsa imhoffii]